MQVIEPDWRRFAEQPLAPSADELARAYARVIEQAGFVLGDWQRRVVEQLAPALAQVGAQLGEIGRPAGRCADPRVFGHRPRCRCDDD